MTVCHRVRPCRRRSNGRPGWRHRESARPDRSRKSAARRPWSAPIAWAAECRSPVDRKHADTVVAAIGDVDVAAGAIDRDLGAGRIAGEIGRRRTQHVKRRELAGPAILPVGRDRGIELVQHIGQRAPRVEADMARPSTGTGGDARASRPARHACVEAVGDDAVAALARDIEESALGIERDVVRIHADLLGLVRAELAADDRQLRVGTQAPVTPHRQHADRVAGVVGDGKVPAGRIEGQMHRIVAAGRLAVDQRELSGGRSTAKAVASVRAPCTE